MRTDAISDMNRLDTQRYNYTRTGCCLKQSGGPPGAKAVFLLFIRSVLSPAKSAVAYPMPKWRADPSCAVRLSFNGPVREFEKGRNQAAQHTVPNGHARISPPYAVYAASEKSLIVKKSAVRKGGMERSNTTVTGADRSERSPATGVCRLALYFRGARSPKRPKSSLSVSAAPRSRLTSSMTS